MEFARFGNTDFLFVLSERGSVAGVYRIEDGVPVLHQLLPSGVSPEGVIAIPARGLIATANEADLIEDGAARAHVMIFELQDGPAAYPSITSAGTEELIGWGALSGLVADAEVPGRLFAVNDSYYALQPTIFEIDATVTPARITRAIRVTRDGAPAERMDMEGITLDRQGGFWLANEGDAAKDIPHGLVRVDGTGAIQEEIVFPATLLEHQTRFGAEGVTWVGDRLWIAMQREWADDPKGEVKLVSYDPASGEWGAVRYPLDAVETGWIGLSEITAHGDHVYIVERDNQIGANARIKQLTRVAVTELEPAPLGGELPLVGKEVVRDFLPDLAGQRGYIVDKIEGFAIDAGGAAYAVTDNDGVEDSSGETHFLPLGPISSAM